MADGARAANGGSNAAAAAAANGGGGAAAPAPAAASGGAGGRNSGNSAPPSSTAGYGVSPALPPGVTPEMIAAYVKANPTSGGVSTSGASSKLPPAELGWRNSVKRTVALGFGKAEYGEKGDLKIVWIMKPADDQLKWVSQYLNEQLSNKNPKILTATFYRSTLGFMGLGKKSAFININYEPGFEMDDRKLPSKKLEIQYDRGETPVLIIPRKILSKINPDPSEALKAIKTGLEFKGVDAATYYILDENPWEQKGGYRRSNRKNRRSKTSRKNRKSRKSKNNRKNRQSRRN